MQQAEAESPATNGAAAVLDDIKIFNRVMTAAEIPALMEGCRDRAGVGP